MRRTLLRLSFALAVLPIAIPIHAAPSTPAVDPALLAGLKARSIGPAAMSGRVTSLEGVASDPETLYVGAAAGGVWKSVNGGLTWRPIFDDQPVASIGAIAVFQANPDIVWVGTGEGNVRNSVSVGDGVYRSLDGGITWRYLGLPESEHIPSLALHPSDPNVAYVAALGKAWGENPERGIFRTSDGGRSWKKVLYVDERTGGAAVVMDPKNPNHLFAALWEFRRWPWSFRSGGPGSGLYVTWDGGDSWKRLGEDDGLPKGKLGRIGLAISRSNPEIVYAIVETEKKNVVLRSGDGGRSWKAGSTENGATERPFYYSRIEVDPQWPNRLYSLTSRLRVSNDGGKTFERLGRSNEIHGDYHAIWIAPGQPAHLLVGQDGGVGMSRDRGESWQFAANLPFGQYYHVAADMDMPYHLYGGLQDNGAWRGPSAVWTRGDIRNTVWSVIGGGDGFVTLPDPRDSRTGYSESQGGELGRWNVETGSIKAIKPPDPNPDDPARRLRFNWNAALAQDPFDLSTIYLGSQYVHKSTDRGETWTIISPDLTTDNPAWQKQGESGGLTLDATAAENYTTLLTIAPSPLVKGVVWTGSDDGRVHVTRDGGTTWTSVEANLQGVPAGAWVPQIRPSKFDPASAFVVFDDHRRSSWTPYAFRTDDYGKSWKSLIVGGSGVRGYALSIEQDPVDRDLLFLGTEFGLYVSTDGGGRWLRFSHGVPTTSVMDLLVHPRDHDLIVATHGRALFVIDDISPLRTLSAATMGEPLHLFPPAPAQQHEVGFGGSGPNRPGAGEFRGENRPYGALLTYSLNLPDLPLPERDKERERKEAAARTALTAPAAGGKATVPPIAAKTEDPAPAAAPGAAEAEAGSDEADAGPGAGGPGGAREPKVEIRIADANGKTVRTFKGPAKLGVNRAVWDLGRDPWKQAPDTERAPRGEERSGPQVPPGTYTVTLKLEGHEAKGTVRVVADLGSHLSPAEDAEREAAVRRVGELQNAIVEAIRRIAATRADVETVLKKARAGDEAKEPKDGKEAKPNRELTKAAHQLETKLSDLARRLFIPPTLKGIHEDRTALTRVGTVGESLDSSFEALNATQKLQLQQVDAATRAVLADADKLFAEDVAQFRAQVQAAGLGLLAETKPLAIGGATP